MTDELLDRAACGLAQTAVDGTIRRVNRMFCDWLGYSAAELVGKRRLQDLLTMGAKIFHQTHWAPLLQMQGSLSEVKLELVHADGSTIPMVMNAIVRTDERGGPVHEIAAFIARDRDRYEHELVLSRRRLETALSELTALHGQARDRAQFAEQMIGIVSHDLRNPLAAIGMATEVLGANATPKVVERVLPRLSRAVDRANRLIADLLDFTAARVGSGISVSIDPEVDVHRAIGEILEDLRDVYPTRALLQVADGAGVFELDVNRLGQLVGNLVGNAVAYGGPMSPITVAARVGATECEVSVHNHGPAIPPEVAASLFEPMTRGTAAGSQQRSVGLGLYIVREIARAHGGSVAVTSTAEAGTTFTARFTRRTS